MDDQILQQRNSRNTSIRDGYVDLRLCQLHTNHARQNWSQSLELTCDRLRPEQKSLF